MTDAKTKQMNEERIKKEKDPKINSLAGPLPTTQQIKHWTNESDLTIYHLHMGNNCSYKNINGPIIVCSTN